VGKALKRHRRLFVPKFLLHASRPGRHTVISLIAGAGTGQHSIEVARRFRDAHVLAIDLSLSSPCLCRRKSQELGLSQYRIWQPISRVGALGRNFDLIEARVSCTI